MAVSVREIRHLTDRSETGRLSSMVQSPAQYTLSEPVRPPWHGRVEAKLMRLLSLQAGWDSYGGAKISRMAISAAADVLAQEFFRRLPEPQIVPTSSGHVQAEWVVRGKLLEVEFVSDTEINVSLSRDPDAACEEATVSFDLSPLAAYAADLMT